MKREEYLIDCSSFQSVMDASYNGIIAVNARGKIIVFNKAAKKILKMGESNILGRQFKEFDPVTWPEYQKILKTGIPQVGIRNKIGDLTLIANRTPVIVGNKIKGVVSVFQDVSEFEKISKELSSYKQLAKELDTIIESSYDGISVTDGKGVLLRVNPSWEKITGLSASQVIGRNMEDLEKEGFFSEAIPVQVLKYRRRITKPSYVIATSREVLVTGTPIFGDNGNIMMVVTNVRDMTDLNDLNKQLEKSRRLAKKYYSKLKEISTSIQQVHLEDIVAVSKQMRDVMELASRVTETDAPVLIQGETGVGKEVIAKYIHDKSSRSKAGLFVKINCGAIPENLLESELFGYEKGAFTGARNTGKKGRLELAEGGTAFLDEIEALPMNLQVKLLNVVQDLEMIPLGGTEAKKIDIRIIAASNHNLYEMVKEGRFREDLFFRLNVVPVYIPPLRERKEDILPLIHFFLQRHNNRYGKKKYLSRPVLDCLLEYQWEGNVRELGNLIEQLVVVTKDEEVKLDDLPGHVRFNNRTILGKFSLDNVCSLKQAVKDFEARLICEAINRYGNARRAAAFLKVDPSTISRKISKAKPSIAEKKNSAFLQY